MSNSKTFYEYQIAVYTDGVESVSKSIVIKWREQIDYNEARKRLGGMVNNHDLLPENASHVQLRDAEGQPISEIWTVTPQE